MGKNRNDAVYAMLRDLSVEEITALARRGGAMRAALARDYMVSPRSYSLDSQEAAEDAITEERTLSAAAVTWAKLDPVTRRAVLALTHEPDDWRRLLEIRVPLKHSQHGCATCQDVQADAASERFRTFDRERIVDESHFSMTIITCPACGAKLLHVFMELIDWDGGDDSQGTCTIPLAPGEAELLRNAGEDSAEAVLHQMRPARRHLCWVHPRGGTASAFWREGEVLLLPHD